MGPPTQTPIGLALAAAARSVGRAFDEAMAAAGGSQSTWVILIALKTRRIANQRELAEAVGIRQATLTHHLNAMEAAGLVERQRDPANRRIQHVTLTAAGEAAFARLRGVAMVFDQRLRLGLDEGQLTSFRDVLDALVANVITELE
jgi:MarR family transcriptional regulator for hemolysin